MESEPASPIETLPAPDEKKRSSALMLGYAFAAMGAALFSTKAIFVKLAYAETIDAETLLALRMALSFPFYLAIGGFSLFERFRDQRSLPSFGLVLRSALVGALGYWFASYTDFIGLVYISAQFERLILFTYPLFVVLFGAWFFSFPIRRNTLIAFGVSYIGLALIFTENVGIAGDHVAIGAGFVLLAASSFALYQLLAKGLVSRVGPRLFTCIAMSGATIAAFVQFLIGHDASAILFGPELLTYGILIAVFATVLPSFFLSEALHRISAQANGIIGTISPLVTIILAAIILGERLTPLGMFGTVLVLGGVGWFTVAERR